MNVDFGALEAFATTVSGNYQALKQDLEDLLPAAFVAANLPASQGFAVPGSQEFAKNMTLATQTMRTFGAGEYGSILFSALFAHNTKSIWSDFDGSAADQMVKIALKKVADSVPTVPPGANAGATPPDANASAKPSAGGPGKPK
jgi:hypothetical protein